MDDLVLLIGAAFSEQNGFGAPVSKLDTTPCWVTVKSVTRAEWQAAGRKGLNPAFVLTTNRANYGGQAAVEYNGRRYAVYRTYSPPDSDEVELYIQEEVGITNSPAPTEGD